MKKFLVNLMCLFIPNKKIRQHLRYKYIRGYYKNLKDKGYIAKKTKNGIEINGHGLKIFGTADNTLWTAETVFGGEYDFVPANKDEKFIVIDIGLNLAMTSLWLAKKKFISDIYGYEPFLPTFELALNNLSLNPALAKKIKVFNYGLSNHNGTIQIDYNPNRPGSMSTIKNSFAGMGETLTAELRCSSKVLKPIFDKHKNSSIMLKIDCEGGEQEILPDLAASGLLDRVRIVIMEYHFGMMEPFVKLFKTHGFKAKVYNESKTCSTGMIYAEKPLPKK